MLRNNDVRERRTLVRLAGPLICLSLLLLGAALLCAGPGAAQEAEYSVDLYPVCFIGNDVVDLQWHVAGSGVAFQSYIVYRDGVEQAVFTQRDQTFYRDAGRAKGAQHIYDVSMVPQQGAPECTARTITVGQVQGYLYRDLTWGAGVYDVYGNVDVRAGVTLRIGPGAQVIERGSMIILRANTGGVIQVDGATLRNVDAYLQAPRTWIKDSQVYHGTFSGFGAGALLIAGNVFSDGADLMIHETTRPAITDNTLHRSEISLHNTVSATIAYNQFQKSSLIVDDDSSTRVACNDFQDSETYDYCLMASNSGALEIANNRFLNGADDDDTASISLSDGAHAAILNNLIDGGDDGILVGVTSAPSAPPTFATIRGNTLRNADNFAMWLYKGSDVTVSENTIQDNFYGIAINDLGRAQIQNNCITGNTAGLAIWGDTPAGNVQAAGNWWGSAGGPRPGDEGVTPIVEERP